MQIIHGTWIPDSAQPEKGSFCLWLEGPLGPEETTEPLHNLVGKSATCAQRYFWLPSSKKKPILSPHLLALTEVTPPAKSTLHLYAISCLQVENVYITLQLLSLRNESPFVMGEDLLFWLQIIQALRRAISRHLYVPCVRRNRGSKSALRTSWELVSQEFEQQAIDYSRAMPLLCCAGINDKQTQPALYPPVDLIHHFAHCQLTRLIENTRFTQAQRKQVEHCFLGGCLGDPVGPTQQEYEQWQGWWNRIVPTKQHQGCQFGFRLEEPKKGTQWPLRFLLCSTQDVSIQLPLADYWSAKPKRKRELQKMLGEPNEHFALTQLALAARIFPLIWQGVRESAPAAALLDTAQAFSFLKEGAWILQDAGYRVIVPAWYTPSGRRRAQLRLKTNSPTTAKGANSKLSMQQLVNFDVELSLGGERVSKQEWRQLLAMREPLVRFRGQWVELEQEKMTQMLQLLEQQTAEKQEITFLELLRRQSDALYQVEHDASVSKMMAQLQDHTQFELVDDPAHLQGALRPYQKRGLSWIELMESMELNGILADDMGLGKTVQVIARLLSERKDQNRLAPTLLIAPTSVLGNWARELRRFGPTLEHFIHHGVERLSNKEQFIERAAQHDVVIVSYALARRDASLLKTVDWHRVVLDEAQNVKNPKAAQTRAICSLPAKHRLALTGTPVENRLLDLWSIFHFLNPGYLGSESQFRNQFEKPIQTEQGSPQAETLKQLIQPFILRRVKTDKTIINDLPDKVEQTLPVNLSKEQASLYTLIVKEVEKELNEGEANNRGGVILSTLLKLKQVCNHPAQFLQDGSAFLPERSQKMVRLQEMLLEAIENGESVLIFSQFRETVQALAYHLRNSLHLPTYTIHGGTSRQQREKIVTAFQDPDTEPTILILSLKAAGVGLNLTKANRIFHIDRWWNPAVEEQATDRAYRIGQEQTVFVHKFITTGTIEERIDQIIEEKRQLGDAIVGKDESWLTKLDNQTFLNLIQLSDGQVMEEAI